MSLFGLSTMPWALSACGGGDAGSAVSASKVPEGSRGGTIEHESCDESGRKVVLLDATNDGKPDIKRVFDSSSQRELCRIADLNHDGRPDMFEYFDSAGQLRRREADYDDNGVVNAIEYYEGGKLARKELDTANRNRIDTWDYYDVATGRRVRRERDSGGNGRVDQWWTWEGDKVTIAVDKDGDGKPDPATNVVMGSAGDEYVRSAAGSADGGATSSSSSSQASDGGASEALPTAPESNADASSPANGGKP